MMPAARLGDMHTCPMVTPGLPPIPHVGGPIVSPCVPNVLIGMMPAAVVGDMCTCVGPPDAIAMGSPTVLIGGRMAARVGDSTVHGGVIVVGCPSVLIGTGAASGAGPLNSLCPTIAGLGDLSPQERLEQLQAMEEALANSNSDAAAKLAESRHTLEMAMLSNATYDPDNPNLIPPGYSRVTDDNLATLGLTPKDLEPDQFIYQRQGPNNTDPHYVVAYRGTANGADVATDVKQALGFQDESYTRSLATAQKLEGYDVEYTGHSKGGGQAAASGAITGQPATTFNAAGVHQDTLTDTGINANQARGPHPNIQAYHNSRDPLTLAQENREAVILGVGAAGYAVSSIPFIGPLLGAGLKGLALYAGSTGGVPKALGNQHEVPAHDGQGLSPLNGHSMDHMIQAITEQQDEMLKDLCGC